MIEIIEILWTCCKAQDGVRLSPDWRRARGRPPTTWIHQICRDTGIPVTDRRSGASRREIATAGCYGWTLRVMMMTMMMMMMLLLLLLLFCVGAWCVRAGASARSRVAGECPRWWVHRRQLVIVCWRRLVGSTTCRLHPATGRLRAALGPAHGVPQLWARRSSLSRVLRHGRRRSAQSASLPAPRRAAFARVNHRQ